MAGLRPAYAAFSDFAGDLRNTLTLQQPQVNSKLCIGCGICENKCPVAGQAAIRVTGIERG
jgi:Pyruvate/2-oxoacid:ferredoxin oxidoreductase delta subunit